MKLMEMPLAEFTNITASDAPAPGGGSVAALCGSLGAALTHMVAALTVDKKKFAEYREQNTALMRDAEALRTKLEALVDRDTEAFAHMMTALKRPKETDEEKAARKEAMQAALRLCTTVPLETMACCAEGLALCADALEYGNPNALSDLGVAALTLRTGLEGAWLNVLINLPGIDDEDFRENRRKEGEKYLEKALPLAKSVYAAVLAAVKG